MWHYITLDIGQDRTAARTGTASHSIHWRVIVIVIGTRHQIQATIRAAALTE